MTQTLHIKKMVCDGLNFIVLDTYFDRRNRKLKSVISQIKNNKMPMYLNSLSHREAIFSDEERLAFIDCLTELKRKL